jgi:transposase
MIPGVATILAVKIAAHSDYLERFATIDKFLEYAGIAPLGKASGKIKETCRIIKAIDSLTALYTWLPSSNQP